MVQPWNTRSQIGDMWGQWWDSSFYFSQAAVYAKVIDVHVSIGFQGCVWFGRPFFQLTCVFADTKKSIKLYILLMNPFRTLFNWILWLFLLCFVETAACEELLCNLRSKASQTLQMAVSSPWEVQIGHTHTAQQCGAQPREVSLWYPYGTCGVHAVFFFFFAYTLPACTWYKGQNARYVDLFDSQTFWDKLRTEKRVL